MMAAKEVILLVVFFFHSCNPASLPPLGRTFPVVPLPANTEYKSQHLDSAESGGNVFPEQGSKFQHAFGSRGVTGGHMAGAGEDGNGGGTHSTYPQGGAAVIPVYAAGAGHGQRNNHHSAGSCIHFSIGYSALTAHLLAYLLLINAYEF